MPTKEEKNKFYKEIEKIVIDAKGDLNWIEAITHYCQTTGMEVEVAATLVGDKLKKKLLEVAIDKNYLKKNGNGRLKNV